MLLVGGESQLADLAVGGGGNPAEQLLVFLFGAIQVLVKVASFQNSFFEFGLFVGGVAGIVGLNGRGGYLIGGEDEGGSVGFAVLEEDGGNRFRRFGEAECGGEVLDGCGEVEGDMRVVAVGFEGSEGEQMGGFCDCLVF